MINLKSGDFEFVLESEEHQVIIGYEGNIVGMIEVSSLLAVAMGLAEGQRNMKEFNLK